MRNSAGNFAGDSNTATSIRFIHSDSGTDDWQRMNRVPFLFDTSSLGGRVLSATLDFYVQTGVVSDFMTMLNLYSVAPASNTALAAGDFDSVGTTAYSDTGLDISMLSEDAYNQLTLNSDGRNAVDINGVTKLCLCSESERDNSDPGWVPTSEDSATIRFAEFSGTSSDPKLIVTMGSSGERALLGIGT